MNCSPGFRAALCGRGSASPVAPELRHGMQLLRRCRENPRVREKGEKEEEENEENEGPPPVPTSRFFMTSLGSPGTFPGTGFSSRVVFFFHDSTGSFEGPRTSCVTASVAFVWSPGGVSGPRARQKTIRGEEKCLVEGVRTSGGLRREQIGTLGSGGGGER